jgi:uncharacterized protein (DUF2236 family)
MGEYLFGPDSMMWRINRESVLIVGGRAALLMQLAHPLVAAGVGDHSDFRSDPIKRLRRTLDAMLSIVFGDEETARRTADAVNRVHQHVNGVAGDGRSYSALDTHLMQWVHATLVDSSVRVYEACVATLTDEERSRYYEETKVVGELFGIPRSDLPARLGDMREWMREMIASGEVVVTPLAREIAAPILKSLPFVPLRLARSAAFVEAGLLPRPIREGYGLKLSRPRSALLAVGRSTSRLLWPRLPRAVRAWSTAKKAERPT